MIITYEERLSYLYYVNPSYASKILNLMDNNPEFLSIKFNCLN